MVFFSGSSAKEPRKLENGTYVSLYEEKFRRREEGKKERERIKEGKMERSTWTKGQ